MTASFPCPYLNAEVKLTEEREKHIAEHHPELLPAHRNQITTTLADPDLIRRSIRLGRARLFSRWYTELGGGKHLVVVVVSDPVAGGRHWIITAYFARKLAEGEIEWSRS
ncbi:MAG: hypothetical protein HYS38_03125 [Acidobacteria bacterium]|nr:hypothetical protein [Acidobacteriota bacterium]